MEVVIVVGFGEGVEGDDASVFRVETGFGVGKLRYLGKVGSCTLGLR